MVTLILGPGSSMACINVTIIDDLEPELGVEFFSLIITSTDTAVIVTDPLAPVGILNDDSKFIIIISYYIILYFRFLFFVCSCMCIF